MTTSTQNIVGLLVGIWPRIIGFSNTPSLLVIALIANLVAAIPTAFRIQRENGACEGGVAACTESTPMTVSSN